MDEIAARQIDESIRRFIDEYRLRIDKREYELILSAANVVDNGINKAIIDEVYEAIRLIIFEGNF